MAVTLLEFRPLADLAVIDANAGTTALDPRGESQVIGLTLGGEVKLHLHIGNIGTGMTSTSFILQLEQLVDGGGRKGNSSRQYISFSHRHSPGGLGET